MFQQRFGNEEHITVGFTIRAVLLDLYGTIAYIPSEDYRDTKLRMAKVIGCDPEKFQNIWRSLTTESTTGELATTVDRVNATLAQMGISVSPAEAEEMARIETELQEERVRLLPGALKALAALRGLQLRLALVTNCSSSAVNAPDRLGLTPFFDALVLSFEVGVVKPDPRIYAIACERIGIPANECVFAGDGDCHELEGAQAVGIKAIKVGGSEEIALHVEPSLTYDYTVNSFAELPALLRNLLND